MCGETVSALSYLLVSCIVLQQFGKGKMWFTLSLEEDEKKGREEQTWEMTEREEQWWALIILETSWEISTEQETPIHQWKSFQI